MSDKETQETASNPPTDNSQQDGGLTGMHMSLLFNFILLCWAIAMTVLFAQEKNKEPIPDTVHREGKLGVGALSHVNIIVNDTIDIGAAYYEEVLGFERASNADGPMDYRNVTNHGFCVDAGFDACRVDIIFLKHPVIGMHLELFFYYEPRGDLQIAAPNGSARLALGS